MSVLERVDCICEAVPDPCSGPYGLDKLLEVHFKFPFTLIGKLTMAFLTTPSCEILESWHKGVGPGQGFWYCF